MYHLLYEHLDYVLNKEVRKTLIDTQKYSLADGVRLINEWLF